MNIENWADIRELVLMSLGTNKTTWAQDPQFGSDLWLLRQTGKVDGNTAGTLRRMVLEALNWLVSDGLVQNIECKAERSGSAAIVYTITVYKPDGSSSEITEVWNAL